MIKSFKKTIRKIVPSSILNYFIPRKFDKFIRIQDDIGNKAFYMYLRKDSFMEKKFLNKGLYGEWEKESLKIWAEISKKAYTIIDIGANTGIYSLLAYNNNAKSTIIAIEPVELNFNVLTQNIYKNKFTITTEMVGLSDKDGKAKMYMIKDQINYMTSINDNRYAAQPDFKPNNEIIEIDVTTRTFSYIFEKYNLKNLDLVKIDVEGHEPAVVNGMLTYLEMFKPTILVEIIGDNNAKILDNIFRKMGYEYISIDEQQKSMVVDKLWDNHHHNFLICNKNMRESLQLKNLVN